MFPALRSRSAVAAAVALLTTVKSTAPFERVVEALERAVTEEKTAVVCGANAQRGAAGSGVTKSGADGLPE